jgi:hypothetical protein
MTTNTNSINNAPNTNIAAHSILLSEGASPAAGLLLTAGQIPIGTTSGDPVGAQLIAGTNISITSVSGSITIAASNLDAFAWNNVATGTQALAVNQGYITNNGASLVTYTLPATAAQGTEIAVAGFSAGGWMIAQNASQLIHFGNQVTTTGTGGSLSSTNQYDQVLLLCVVANTTWVVLNAVGNLTYV